MRSLYSPNSENCCLKYIMEKGKFKSNSDNYTVGCLMKRLPMLFQMS